jgi:hypothetical protein
MFFFIFKYRLWYTTHPISCPGYKRPTDPTVNDTSLSVCSDLMLTAIECNLPLCPMPNDTIASALDTSISVSKLLANSTNRKNGTQIQFQCTTPCKENIKNLVLNCYQYFLCCDFVGFVLKEHHIIFFCKETCTNNYIQNS